MTVHRSVIVEWSKIKWRFSWVMAILGSYIMMWPHLVESLNFTWPSLKKQPLNVWRKKNGIQVQPSVAANAIALH